MKTIYMFSIDDDISQSIDVVNQFKVLCYMMYDEIGMLEEDGNRVLYRDNIIYNELMESGGNGVYHYRFKYKDYKSGKYEPFMLDDYSFCFTVNSGAISFDEITFFLEKVKGMIKFHYNVTVESVDYLQDDKNINRIEAIKGLVSDEEVNAEVNKKRSRIKLARNFS